jgi:uncharacterized protein YkwD
MSSPRRSPVLALVAALVASGIFAAATSAVEASASPATQPFVASAAAPGAPEIEAAEQRVIDRINVRRDRKGLRPLRLDPRVAAVARARSQDMIDRDYFSHQDPDGKYARQHLERAHIRFSRVSEIIAWNGGTDLLAGADAVVRMWMGDAVHRHEVMSTTHNYLGAGVATDGRTVKWTVISITGPDRTDPTARVTSVALDGATATVLWQGHDPRLVVATAGIRDYDLARRDPGGAWETVLNDTTEVSGRSAAREGTEFRVRARDKAGNVGPWSVPVAAAPAPA